MEEGDLVWKWELGFLSVISVVWERDMSELACLRERIPDDLLNPMHRIVLTSNFVKGTSSCLTVSSFDCPVFPTFHGCSPLSAS